MDAVQTYRDQIRKAGIQSLGLDSKLSRFFSIQQRMDIDLSGFYALPEMVLPPIQDLDPLSATYGKTYFTAGVHEFGDPDHPFYSG